MTDRKDGHFINDKDQIGMLLLLQSSCTDQREKSYSIALKVKKESFQWVSLKKLHHGLFVINLHTDDGTFGETHSIEEKARERTEFILTAYGFGDQAHQIVTEILFQEYNEYNEYNEIPNKTSSY